MSTIRPNVPQFFLDDQWIAAQRRVMRRWMPADIHPNPTIQPDRPWEGHSLWLYGTVLGNTHDGFRMIYTGKSFRTKPAGPLNNGRIFLALSDDGLTWRKPELGLTDWDGSRANNMLFEPGQYQDGVSVMHDPQDHAWPLKMIGWESGNVPGAGGDGPGLYAYRSADGQKWDSVPGRRAITGDRTNVMVERVDGQCVAYSRHHEMMDLIGARSIWRIQSEDFLTWSEPQLVLAPDLHDPPDVEYYGMPVFRRHGWFFGLLEYWHADTDVMAVHLVFSRDGVRWHHPTPRRPFIAPTYHWNRMWNTCASNGPIILNEQMLFYFNGRSIGHNLNTVQQHGVIGSASLELDRFCAIEGQVGGRLDTPTFTWPGGTLTVNADTRHAFQGHAGHITGRLDVEVLDADGAPLPDWSGQRRATFQGNTHCRGKVVPGEVVWPTDRRLDALAGQPIRLRFDLDHARLFTFAATDTVDAS